MPRISLRSSGLHDYATRRVFTPFRLWLRPERGADLRREAAEMPYAGKADEPDRQEGEVEIARGYLRIARMQHQRGDAQRDGGACDAERIAHLLEHAE